MKRDIRTHLRRWIMLGGMFSALATAITAVGRDVMSARLATALVGWLILLGAVLWARREPARWLLVIALMGVTLLSIEQAVPPTSITMYSMLIITFVTVLPLWAATILTVAVGLAVSMLFRNLAIMGPTSVGFAIPVLFMYLCALTIRQTMVERLRAEALTATVIEQNQQLQHYNDGLEMVAVAQERARLAQELHDRLGHALMTINVHLRVLQRRTIKEVPYEKAVSHALGASSEAMGELRRCIGLLQDRKRDASLTNAMNELLTDLPHFPEVDFTVLGEPRSMSPVKEFALLRVLQEGLTNIAKHAHANRVTIALTYSDGEVVLSVKDDGVGCVAVDEGVGLRGMRERLQQVGGMLYLDSEPAHGFAIRAVVGP